MKVNNLLILLVVGQFGFFTSSFALSPTECQEQGVQCLCISHPGAETVCTSVTRTMFSLGDKQDLSQTRRADSK